MKSIKFLRYFIYVMIFVIGLLIGIAIRHYNNVPFSQELNLVDLAALVATIFLAIYIPEVLDRKLQNTRDKKVLLENKVAEFQSLIKTVNEIVQDDGEITPKEYLTIKNTLDVSKNKLEIIASLIPFAKFESIFDADINNLRSLVDQHEKLLNKDRKIKEPFEYDDDVKDQEEKLYNKIDQACILLIFKISDS